MSWLAQNWDALITILNTIGLFIIQGSKQPKK